jgi:hypothetical protein
VKILRKFTKIPAFAHDFSKCSILIVDISEELKTVVEPVVLLFIFPIPLLTSLFLFDIKSLNNL